MEQTSQIHRSRKYSLEKIEIFKRALSYVHEQGVDLVVTGSFAREEAHEKSDLDYFLLCPEGFDERTGAALADQVKSDLTRLVENQPKPGGTWGHFDTIGKLDTNIGGDEERNSSFTRRILFLVESKSLYSTTTYEEGRKKLNERYIGEAISAHQLGQFFLNDLIRYYRTMCVDFEHKTVEKGAPWGLANIKLVFSRKMLYFSSILVAAELYEHDYVRKREIFDKMLRMSPVARVEEVCGTASVKLLQIYDSFLEFMSRPDTRQKLLDIEQKHEMSEEVQELKHLGLHMANQMILCLNATYPPVHPIYRSLMF